jgi:ABC-2 type transport system permease protein
VIRPSVALARRAVRNAFRRPQFLAPLVIFPTLFLAVNVGGLSQARTLPGFPETTSFFAFQLPAAITQSLLLGGVSVGIAAALDIEGGFFDRLVAAPVPRSALVLGRVLAAGVLGLCQTVYFLALGLVFGAHVEAGIPGALVVLLIAGWAGLAFGCIGVALALRARSASTVQGIFPLVFVILFLSSAFFPQALLQSPIDVIAKYNPLSYIADGMRDPMISSMSLEPVLEGLAAAIGLALVMGFIAERSLRVRLGRA